MSASKHKRLERPAPDAENEREQPAEAPAPQHPGEAANGTETVQEEKTRKKKSKLGSKRGIETLFRTQYPLHMDLSAIADSKSNIMISINGIIISIILGTISPGIDTNPWLLIPTAVLLVGCLVSMTFAVLAAIPRVTRSEVTLEDFRQDRANILFFGNFVRLSRPDYVDGMTELLQTRGRLYTSMMGDIYSLGRVLDRKFRLLRISYGAFIIGLVIGVALFIGVFVFVATTPVQSPPGLP